MVSVKNGIAVRRPKKEATKCASKPASSAQCFCGRCATVLALTRRRRFSRTDAISDDDVADDAE